METTTWNKIVTLCGHPSFTARMRRVLQFANQEAQRFGHDYVDAPDLLLGLIKEGTGTAISALKNLGIDPAKLRREIENIIEQGPDVVTMGNLPFTKDASDVIQCTAACAKHAGHRFVGTEHLLLGFLRDQGGNTARILREISCRVGVEKRYERLTFEIARDEVHKILDQKKEKVAPATRILTLHGVVFPEKLTADLEGLDEFLRTVIDLPEGKIKRVLVEME